MAGLENGPVEDVFPIENRDFPASHVSSLEETSSIFPTKPWCFRRHLPHQGRVLDGLMAQ